MTPHGLTYSWVSLGYFAVNLSGGQPKMYWWLCCTRVKKSHEIAHFCCQTQDQHIQWKTISLWWLCIDLELTPSEIMTSRETQEYTALHVQVAVILLQACYTAVIKLISGCVRIAFFDLMITSLLDIVNRLDARWLSRILSTNLMQRFSSFVESILCGPVHSEKAVEMFKKTLEDVNASGGEITVGGKVKPLRIQ